MVFWRYAAIAAVALALTGSSGLSQEEGADTFGNDPGSTNVGSAPKNQVVASYAGPSSGGDPGPKHRVIATAGLLDTELSGVTLWHDYGSFKLYRVTEVALGRLPEEARDRLVLLDGADRLRINGVDVSAFSADERALLEAEQPEWSGPALHLVQFVGPIKDEWLQGIEATGATPVQYIASNGYLVWADDEGRSQLDRMAEENLFLQLSVPYWPSFKVGPALAGRIEAADGVDGDVTVVMQVYRHEAAKGTEALIQDLAAEVVSDWTPVLSYRNIVVTVRLSDVALLTARPDVYWIEERLERQMMDEVQDQILAGNFSTDQSGPSVPGYVTWLDGFGFSTNPADYPIVDIADDGIGNGTVNSGDPTLHQFGALANPTRLAYIANCTDSGSGEGPDGHGHLNISIAGGYDARSGFPFQDPLGYQRGQGVNPYGRFAGTRLFDTGFDQSACGGTDTGVIKAIQDNGALISSNSWGCSGCAGSYDDSSQAYDAGVRDADLTQPGNQELIFVFSAGNSGPSAGSVGTPGNAKNVITVGASESQRPADEDGAWTDGCSIGPSGADHAMDIISFSARGPSPGGRVKPEVVAPGTHIQGTASTNAGYTGSSVCDMYRPSGQTVFSASSGSSHSTPAVAGAASLAYWWMENELGVTTPSPALTKAYLIAHPTYLTGVSANDTLPSNSQGYGMPNMGEMFDDEEKFLLDQSVTFDNSGETWTWEGAVADPTRPVRIVMAYTDAPGAIGTSPQVNDLNLAADVDGSVYLGNVFSGQWSVTGGAVDPFNNYEAVFLPTGTDGAIQITVTAFNIAGDGVPNSGDGTDQDFAIVCYNCAQTPTFSLDVTPASLDVCAPADALYNVGVGSILGFSDSVTLAAGGNPAGTTVGFSANPVSPPGSSTLTIGSTGSATAGAYAIVVTGSSTAGTKNRTVDLNLFTAVPAGPALLSPSDGATVVPFKPVYSWTAVAQAASYLLEVAADAGFTNIVYSAGETGTSHTAVVPLSADTTYYWRVTAGNVCGTGTSTTFSFTTKAATMVCNGGAVDFEDGIPADWTVVDNTGGTGIVWTTTADPACEIPNRTNGTGEATCADSDAAGYPAIPYDTELVSNPIDLSSWGGVVLDVKAYYRDISTGTNDRFEVDVWDGTSWTTELSWDEDHEPEDFALNLSAYAGLPTVQLRFRYFGNGYDWYAQVDDVALTCVPASSPVVEVDPASLSSSQGPDLVSVEPLQIRNAGGSPLVWTIQEDQVGVVLEAAEPGPVEARQAPGGIGRGSVVYVPPADAILHSEGSEEGFLPADGWTHLSENPDWSWEIETVSPRSGLRSMQVLYDPAPAPQDEWLVGPEFTAAEATLSFWSFGSLHWCRDDADNCDLDVWLIVGEPGGADDLFVGQADDDWLESFTWSQSVFDLTPLLPENGAVRIGFRYHGTDGAQIGLDDVVLDASNGGACVTPVDIPWLSASPSAGTTIPLGHTDVDVTFDSTGLAPGTYTGALCVNSNDPETPALPVPVSLTVEPPVLLLCDGDPIDFEQGIPSGWVVVDNTGGTGIVWTTTADPACEIPNRTNGTGEAACADSDAAGYPAVPYDTELWSNPIDLTAFGAVLLDVKAYYRDLNTGSNDRFEVDVWNGASWINELSWDEDHEPEDFTLNLSAYAGTGGVRLRFRYFGNGYDWYAQVDDIALTCAAAGPPVIGVDPASLAVEQGPDVVSTEGLSISNSGGSPLNWTIVEDDTACDSPADIPWLSVAPDMGATVPLGATLVDVSFDSTGLAVGTYTANLCVNSNDTADPVVQVPVTLTVLPPFALACNGEIADFESGIPSGWQVIDNEGYGVVWTTIAGSGETGNYTGGAGEAATASSDRAGAVQYDTELRTAAIDLSGWLPGDTIALEYLGNYQNYAFRDFLDLDISTDGGATWTTLLSWNEDHGSFRGSTGEAVSIDLAAYAGMSGLRLRWHYYDPTTSDNDWYAQIDEIGLSCIAAPVIDVDPAALSSTQVPGATVTRMLTVGNVGHVDLAWTIQEASPLSPAGAPRSRPGLPLSGEHSLSASPGYVPTTAPFAPKSVAVQGILLNDGSFENGPPPASAWTETTNNTCEWIGDWAAIWGASAFDGTFDFWGGGYCSGSPSTDSVEQAITVPGGGLLSFWYLTYRVDPDDAATDTAYVSVDGTTVWTLDLTEANNSFPDWVNVALDLSAYVGQTVDLELGVVSSGDQTGNIRFDFLEFAAGCALPSDIPWLSVAPTAGTTAPGDSTIVDAIFDSTGLAPGAYSALLCVNSNDPATPLVQVPVSLTVEPFEITVSKTAAAISVPEPGTDVGFTIVVTNPSLSPATIDSLTDTDFGSPCPDAAGTVLGQGESYTCSFTGAVAGNAYDTHENTATAVASDPWGNSDSDSEDAQVGLTDVQPAITVTKSGPTYAYQGATVVFDVVVANDSVATDPVVITSILDDLHGDVAVIPGSSCTVPTPIPPGGAYSCSFPVTLPTDLVGDQTDTVTASGTDDEGNPVSDDDPATVTVLPPSAATDSSLCIFDRYPETDEREFRLLFTPDVQNMPRFKLTASNPGQFYYNAFHIADGPVSFEITVPYPFVTQGAMPVHLYSDVSVYVDENGDRCFLPGGEGAAYGEAITLADHVDSDSDGMPDHATLTITAGPGSGGFVYLNLHLDYGLKGGEDRYDKAVNPDGTADAVDFETLEILIADRTIYDFGARANGTGLTGDSLTNVNEFKRTPGVAGFVWDSGGALVEGAMIRLIIPPSVKFDEPYLDAFSDEDGWYMINYKHTARPTDFPIEVWVGGARVIEETVRLKGNAFAEQHFVLPAP